jgi:hypothetical protein
MKRVSVILLLGALLFSGCASEYYISDAKHPEVVITAAGGVTFRGRFVEPEDLPGLLRGASFSRKDPIYIGAPDDMADWRLKRKVMAILTRGGYTRPILVGAERSFSEVGRTAQQRREDAARERQRRLEELRDRSGRRKVRYK